MSRVEKVVKFIFNFLLLVTAFIIDKSFSRESLFYLMNFVHLSVALLVVLENVVNDLSMFFYFLLGVLSDWWNMRILGLSSFLFILIVVFYRFFKFYSGKSVFYMFGMNWLLYVLLSMLFNEFRLDFFVNYIWGGLAVSFVIMLYNLNKVRSKFF